MSRETGWPRPMGSPGRNEDGTLLRKMPVPWINGEPDEKGLADFYAFRDDMRRAEVERLCCVCGDHLNTTVTVLAYLGNDETSGGWCHPRCGHLTAAMCPHFAKRDHGDIFAWLYVGPGVGVVSPASFEVDTVLPGLTPLDRESLIALATADPWGHDATITRPGDVRGTDHTKETDRDE